MSKRVHLSGSLKRKLKKQRIEKEKLLPRINDFLNRDNLEINSCLCTTVKSTHAETTDIVSSLMLPVYYSLKCLNKINVILKRKTELLFIQYYLTMSKIPIK